MKKIKYLFIAALAIAISACTPGYNPEKCEEIIEKSDDGKKLNEDDINTALAQCEVITSTIENQLEKCISLAKNKNDKAIDLFYEIQDDDEDMVDNYRKLKYALSDARLKGEQKTQYKDLEKRWEKIFKNYEKAHEKVRKLED